MVSITLQDFEKKLTKDALLKAKLYFENKQVEDLEFDENLWTSNVVGSNVYFVEIEISENNKIVRTACECPHEVEYCKHKVATLYAIQNNGSSSKKIIPNTNKKTKLELFAEKIDKNELIKFIEIYSKKDKKFKIDFDIYFAEKDNNINLSDIYLKKVKSLIKKATKYGYVEYGETRKLSKEFDTIVDDIGNLIIKGDVFNSFLIFKSILPEIIDIIHSVDDSSGYIGGSIENIMLLGEKIFNNNNCKSDIKVEIFEFLSNELKNPIYFDYGDFGYVFLELLEKGAIELGLEDKYINFNKNLQTSSNTSKYLKKDLLQKLIGFYKNIGRTSESMALFNENLEIPELRKVKVKELIDDKKYKEAKKILKDGIDIAQKKGHTGTINEWKEFLLEIAIAEKDIIQERELLKHFTFNGHGVSTSYYKKWKATYTKEEWRPLIDKHIEEVTESITKKHNNENSYWRRKHPFLLNDLHVIYTEEGYLDKLFEQLILEDNLEITLSFTKVLKENFEAPLIDLLIKNFRSFAVSANDRGLYADLVKNMKLVIKQIPASKEKVINLVLELKQRFSVKPRRPAMLDELNKMLPK